MVIYLLLRGDIRIRSIPPSKELDENSLDAGAISVQVRPKAYGKDWFKVTDGQTARHWAPQFPGESYFNGRMHPPISSAKHFHGLPAVNHAAVTYQAFALKHYTSETFGFSDIKVSLGSGGGARSSLRVGGYSRFRGEEDHEFKRSNVLVISDRKSGAGLGHGGGR